MAPSSSVCFMAVCFAITSWFPSCCSTTGRRFAQDLQHMNKTMSGDAVVTYYDVTAVTCAARCASKYPCSGFAYNEEERVCTLCGLCGDFRLVDAPGYLLYATEGFIDTSRNQANICPNDMAYPQNCWKLSPGGLTHVSVGPSGAWGVNGAYQIYYRPHTYHDPLSYGSSWSQVDGLLRQLDVGGDTMWGTNPHYIYFRRQNVALSSPAGTQWYGFSANIRMTWMSVSPGGSLWGIDTSSQAVHFLNNVWQVKGTDIQRVDAGLAGVWVLNTTGQLLHRVGTYGDNGSPGTEWRALEGTFQSVASGRDLMVAVDMAGHVWLRTGVSPDTPTGLGWVQYPGFMKQVDVYQTDAGTALWGVNSYGQIFFSVLRD